MRFRHLGFILGFVAVVLFGYWLGSTAVPERAAPKNPAPAAAATVESQVEETLPKFRTSERASNRSFDAEAAALGALSGQRVITFADRESMERFLAKMGQGLKLLGRLDALNSLRIGFSSDADLAGLLDGEGELSFIFPVSTPPLPDGSVQSGAMPLGANLLEWLGITGDNSTWGAGVRVAVLDTGVLQHPAFQNLISAINLVDLPSDLSLVNSHGTAVASLIAGVRSTTPGVAPSAEILSIRVANDLGQSDSFLLAQGIMAAVDAGISLINISMGSPGESAILRKAIEYANERGVLIFAPTGNNGIDQVYYPGASKGVITIGAVDAAGNHLNFSNTGNEVDVSAPGYGVNAAYSNNQAAKYSGTSFSTPIVVGTVAAVMSQAGPGKLTATQAWELVARYLNDGGSAGFDPQLGGGMPALDRVFAADTPGIYDAAVASQRILPPDASNPNGQIEILIQNRGTEPLINTALQVTNGGTRSSYNITTLAPNGVTTVRVPVVQAAVSGASEFKVDAQVFLSGGIVDAKPNNDRRVESYAPAISP